MPSRLPAILLFVVIAALAFGVGGCGEESTGPGNPQPPPQPWQQSAGGGFSDLGLSVATDGTGNVISAGSFQGRANFGGTSVVTAGMTDIYLAKYDPSGTMLWVKSAGGNGFDTGWGVATDASGNIAMTGYFQNTANFGTTSLGPAVGDDMFVARYDASGSLLWAKSAGGAGIDRARGIAVDGSSNIIVAGRFEGSASFDGTTLTSAGGDDIAIAKYNASGALMWAVSAGGPGMDRSWGVRTDATGNVIVTGLYTGTASFDGTMVTAVGVNDVFVAKYSAAGNLVWVRSTGGTGDDKGWDVAVDRSNNVFVTGSFALTATFGPAMFTSAGGLDVFVAKYSAAGTFLWAASGGSTFDDEGLAVAVDGSGNAILTGPFAGMASFGSQSITAADSTDVFMAKYGPSGGLAWVQSAGGTGQDAGLDVASDGSGNVIATGRFAVWASFGSDTLTSAGSDDIFILKSGPSGLE